MSLQIPKFTRVNEFLEMPATLFLQVCKKVTQTGVFFEEFSNSLKIANSKLNVSGCLSMW